MGACDFVTKAVGETAEEAFGVAVEDAKYEHGHGGYTGTIAEKDSFVMIDLPEGEDPEDYAYRLIEKDDPRIADKWGAAGCIRCPDRKNGQRVWLFFGYASS